MPSAEGEMNRASALAQSAMRNSLQRRQARQQAEADAKKRQDVLNKERRTEYNKLAQKLYDEGNTAGAMAVIEQGKKAEIDFDAAPMETMIQNPSLQRQFSDTIQGLVAGDQIPGINAAGPPTPEVQRIQDLIPQEIFTDDFKAKIASGTKLEEIIQDVEELNWYKDFAAMSSDIPFAEKVKVLAAKHGGIPVDADKLKDASIAERKELTKSWLLKEYNSPEINEIVNRITKSNKKLSPGRVKFTLLLRHAIDENKPIPDEWMPFVTRDMEIQEELYRFSAEDAIQKAIAKEQSERVIHPSVVAREVDKVTETTKATTKARKETEFTLEELTPISAEDRGKYGIGAEIKTYVQLANEGFRFPTEGDRNVYKSLASARNEFANLEKAMFGEHGIFTGIGDDYFSRKYEQGELTGAGLAGTPRGQNYKVYKDSLEAFARTLLALKGESSRLSDQDIIGILKSAASIGGVFAAPDSESVARIKYDNQMAQLGRILKMIETNTVINPIGQPGGKEEELVPDYEYDPVSKTLKKVN